MRPSQAIWAAFKLPFQAIGFGATTLVRGRFLNQQSGARLAKRREVRRFINASNTGLLVDGQSLRLSERESFQNVCLIARVGAGKTSRFIIPNILDKAGSRCSIVVNDPKGEAFDATSGAMQKAGFKIVVFDPEHPEQSRRFNPLTEIRDDIELEQIAEILVRSGNQDDKDAFWNKGATRFVSLFLKSLRNAATAQDPRLLTLANLNYLFQNFGRMGKPLDTFMAHATIDPNNPQDQRLWHEWKGLLTGNPESVQSFVLNALTALRALSNRRIAWITARSDFRLDDLRRERTIIYFKTPPQHAEYYSFLTSVFFRSVFNAAMRQIPGKGDLPIYVLYDEFGHSTLPGFVSTANTIRAYKVSLTIVLQSIAQLSARYGRDIAQAIHGGFNAAMTYSGSDPETCQFFEQLCGKVRERQRKDLFTTNPQDSYREFNLLNANEIRTLKQHETVAVLSNRDPYLINTLAYFESRRFRKMAKIEKARLPNRPVDLSTMPIVRL